MENRSQKAIGDIVGSDKVRLVSRRQFAAMIGVAAGSIVLGGCTNSTEAETTSAQNTGGESPENPESVTIVDFSGATVTVPGDVDKIGALLGNSFPQIFFLGGSAKTAVRMDQKDTAWLDVISPDFKSYGIKSIDNPREPNVEDLVAEGVDVVFYWGGLDEQVRKMNDVGIPVIVSNPSVVDFEGPTEWRNLLEQEMRMYASVLGPEATTRAEDWLAYVDEKIAYVSDRTSLLPESEIKRIYFMRKEEDGLQCFAASSYPKIIVQIAGGRLVSEDIDTQGSGFTTVTMEDIIGWDPEFIFTGWTGKVDIILDNEQWAPIDAVKNNRVHLTPCSLNSTFWDYYAESPLEILYIAKTIHPDLFSDLDVAAEVQDFHKRFYGVEITKQQASNMLERKGPNE